MAVRKRFNTMCDVAFTVDHEREDTDSITAEELLDAAQRRIDTLRGLVGFDDKEHEIFEAIGILDTITND